MGAAFARCVDFFLKRRDPIEVYIRIFSEWADTLREGGRGALGIF